MTKLNVLVLHRMGDPRYRREAVRSLEYMIPECRPDLNCIVHDADLPFPDYLKDIDYHLIVLGPTFLCDRYNSVQLSKVKREYAFLNEVQACKIALPQDDYDCSTRLDEWMVEWGVDYIYTVCPDNWHLLYPRSITCAEIRLGYTGYISEKWIDAWNSPKRNAFRTIDVSYRAKKLAANFGQIGRLKWEIADRFKFAIKGHGCFNLDISTDQKNVILGSKWHKFIENSKFCLATPSGSSLLDPYGDIRNCVNWYSAINHKASFCDLEDKCFQGEDGKYSFVAISPRNIEAALAETVQIATHGSYSSLMFPKEQYIPLDEDCGNIKEVVSMMNDQSFVLRLKKQCKEAILSEPRLRQRIIVNEIIDLAERKVNQRQIIVRNQNLVDRSFDRYRSEIDKISDQYWKRKYLRMKIKKTAVYFGVGRVYEVVRPLIRKS